MQHRVDKLPAGVDGSGITVGVMSDSYDTNAAPTAQRTTSPRGDLPGAGNPQATRSRSWCSRTSPADRPTKAARCCRSCTTWRRRRASASPRRTAASSTSPTTSARSPACRVRRTRCRDSRRTSSSTTSSIPTSRCSRTASSRRRSMKSSATGVSYFSSAGNRPATQAYDSKLRIVPGRCRVVGRHQPQLRERRSGAVRRRLPRLRSGQRASTSRRRSSSPTAARSCSSGTSRSIRMPPTPVGPPLVAGRGHGAGGRRRRASRSTARPGSSSRSSSTRTTRPPASPNPDLTFALLDPNGNEIQFVDTGTNPESLILELPLTGTYTVVVDSFEPAQFGDFLYRVQEVEVAEQVLSDYNLLFFLLERHFHRRARRAEPVHQSADRDRRPAGSDAADGHRARQRARTRRTATSRIAFATSASAA